jgi:hypothetical protein
MQAETSVGNLQERDHLEYLGVEVRIIILQIIKN